MPIDTYRGVWYNEGLMDKESRINGLAGKSRDKSRDIPGIFGDKTGDIRQ